MGGGKYYGRRFYSKSPNCLEARADIYRCLSKEVLAAAKMKTLENVVKYKFFEDGTKNVSIPFIVDATGGFSVAAFKLINKLMAFYDDKGIWVEQRESTRFADGNKLGADKTLGRHGGSLR